GALGRPHSPHQPGAPHTGVAGSTAYGDKHWGGAIAERESYAQSSGPRHAPAGSSPPPAPLVPVTPPVPPVALPPAPPACAAPPCPPLPPAAVTRAPAEPPTFVSRPPSARAPPEPAFSPPPIATVSEPPAAAGPMGACRSPPQAPTPSRTRNPMRAEKTCMCSARGGSKTHSTQASSRKQAAPRRHELSNRPVREACPSSSRLVLPVAQRANLCPVAAGRLPLFEGAPSPRALSVPRGPRC